MAALTTEVRMLAEAQRRTEQRVEELAEAQRRTCEEFVAYRHSTDRRLDELSREVKNLSARVGMTLEEGTEDMVWWVLKQKGYRFAEARQSVVSDGELDVVLIGETPTGRSITVLIESKNPFGQARRARLGTTSAIGRFLSRAGGSGVQPAVSALPVRDAP